MPSARIRTLEQETAGYHDGSHVTVLADALGDPMVAAHEAVHDKVFRLTTDGALLCGLLLIGREGTRADIRTKLACSNLAEAILKVSRKAHEEVATYLGIKRAPMIHQYEWFQRLPRDYQDYYKTFSCLDLLFPCRYLQCLIAWNTALVVFCSPHLTRFVETGWDHFSPPRDTETPDARLEKAVMTIRLAGKNNIMKLLNDAAESACKERGTLTWNLESETEWQKADTAAEPVTEQMAKRFREWLSEHAAIEVLARPARYAAENQFYAFLGQNGIKVTDFRPPENGPSYFSPSKLERISTSVSLADSVILNPPHGTIPDGDEALLTTDLLFELPSCILARAEDDVSGRYWYLISPQKLLVETSITLKFPEKSILAFLNRWRHRKSAGLQTPSLLGVVIVAKDLAEYKQLSDLLHRSGPCSMPGVTCCYYVGNWCLLLLELAEKHKLRAGDWSPRIAGIESQSGLPSGIVTKVLALDPGPGIFFRALNHSAAAALEHIEEDLRGFGKLANFEENDLERVKLFITRVGIGFFHYRRDS